MISADEARLLKENYINNTKAKLELIQPDIEKVLTGIITKSSNMGRSSIMVDHVVHDIIGTFRLYDLDWACIEMFILTIFQNKKFIVDMEKLTISW